MHANYFWQNVSKTAALVVFQHKRGELVSYFQNCGQRCTGHSFIHSIFYSFNTHGTLRRTFQRTSSISYLVIDVNNLRQCNLNSLGTFRCSNNPNKAHCYRFFFDVYNEKCMQFAILSHYVNVPNNCRLILLPISMKENQFS